MSEPRSRRSFDYDVVLLGSGWAGGVLALLCRSIGLRVLLVERGDHPRFAIGESVTAEVLRRLDYLAGRYDVPLLRDLSSYTRIKRAGVPIATWPKTHVTFVHHAIGERVDSERPEEVMTQASTWPIGPDAHVYRAELDEFLKDRAVEAGAEYLPHTEPVRFDFDPDTGAHIELRTADAASSRTVRCRLVVDATGSGCWLARHLGLYRQDSADVPMASAAVYAHFRGMKRWEDVLGARPTFLPRDQGTLLHCGTNGVFWVISFDNGITSVGWVTTDPLPEQGEPEALFWDAVRKYPSLYEQMRDAEAVTPYRRVDRLQYSAERIAGDGWFLLPSAAEFSDPLFSVGLPLTSAAIARLMLRIERADRDRPILAEDLAGLEETFRLESRYIRKFTIAAKRCFADYGLMHLAIWLSRMLIFREGAYIDSSSAEAATAAAWSADDDEIRGVGDEFFDFVMKIDFSKPISETTRRDLEALILKWDVDGFFDTAFGRLRPDGIYINSLPRMVDYVIRARHHPLGLGKVRGLAQISGRWFESFLPSRGRKVGPSRRMMKGLIRDQLRVLVHP
jgi:flavin-dependent dehydrogenase